MPRVVNDLEAAAAINDVKCKEGQAFSYEQPPEERAQGPGMKPNGTNVPVYDLVEFIRRHVQPRRFDGKGAVVAKLDIEGAEYKIMKSLLDISKKDPSSIKMVDHYLVELHKIHGGNAEILKLWNASQFSWQTMDDESYGIDPHPLPPLLHTTNSSHIDPWSTMNIKKDGAFWRQPGFHAKQHLNLKRKGGGGMARHQQTNRGDSGAGEAHV
mmetsp:Transcript_11326/g.26609  ORF Transcript_11326/g.26609 Transcript_11326/m.26609 type:complete len:212 (-) Transcript_11326:119-754(-)